MRDEFGISCTENNSMKNFRYALWFKPVIFILLMLVSSAAPYAEEKFLSPETQYAQDQLKNAQESTGYADSEIDNLHRRISSIIPMLDGIISDDGGERKVRVLINSGQSFRVTGEQYVVEGVADIFIRSDNTLEKVVLIYERANSVGNAYLVERRELLNPTPAFYDDGKIDTNDDIVLTFYRSTKPGEDFKEAGQVEFNEIDRHRNRKEILRTYKEYLRKTILSLDKMLADRDTAERDKIKYMLEFE